MQARGRQPDPTDPTDTCFTHPRHLDRQCPYRSPGALPARQNPRWIGGGYPIHRRPKGGSRPPRLKWPDSAQAEKGQRLLLEEVAGRHTLQPTSHAFFWSLGGVGRGQVEAIAVHGLCHMGARRTYGTCGRPKKAQRAGVQWLGEGRRGS